MLQDNDLYHIVKGIEDIEDFIKTSIPVIDSNLSDELKSFIDDFITSKNQYTPIESAVKMLISSEVEAVPELSEPELVEDTPAYLSDDPLIFNTALKDLEGNLVPPPIYKFLLKSQLSSIAAKLSEDQQSESEKIINDLQRFTKYDCVTSMANNSSKEVKKWINDLINKLDE